VLAVLPGAAIGQAVAPSAGAAAVGLHPVKPWLGHEAELEEFLRTATIIGTEQIPIGVTKPKRILFAPGGLAEAAALKHLPAARRGGFWESHKAEIAAYKLDRLLGLGMVPVTVERRVNGDLGSVQFWVQGCRMLKDVDQSACLRPMEFAKQVRRQRVFDDLISNVDRNAGNLLIDREWNLILIDHSRAFASERMPFEKKSQRIDRELLSRLRALDRVTLEAEIGPWVLSNRCLGDLLERRDRIVARFEELARQRGEAAVFPW
jgi:hypothetical protein